MKPPIIEVYSRPRWVGNVCKLPRYRILPAWKRPKGHRAEVIPFPAYAMKKAG
jgi:hypothetical protein